LFGYDIYEKEETPEIVDYILSADGYSRAGIGALPENSETVPTWLGYVRVADVGAAIAKAEELGGSVLLPPTEERLGGDMAIIADPEGTPIGLLRWTYPEPGETQQ
jgi:predicted enzyme related to lactoylglutathione lyase